MGGLWVALSNGAGTFQNSVEYLVPDSGVTPVVADFDRDGKLDLADASAGLLGILTGKGNGTFEAQKLFIAGCPAALAAGDFNGDGKVDVLAANSCSDSVAILTNTTAR